MKKQLNKLVESSHERLRSNRKGYGYLSNVRGFSDNIMRHEKMGYCDHAIAHDFSFSVDSKDKWNLDPEYLQKMLVDRVIIPIRDDCGDVVAVASRVPDKDSKGWWNTPFKKECCLYGMNSARGRAFSKGKLYLFEGYADAITAKQFGLLNSAAVMSTTLTEIQAAIILRYCQEVCVCFDTDPSRNGKLGGGQAGLEKLINKYNKMGFFRFLYAIPLPFKEDGSGNDPDDYIRTNGLDSFLSLEKRVSAVSRG